MTKDEARRIAANIAKVAEIIGEIAPAMPVPISSRVCREIREYERASTTVVNAYAMPRVEA